MRNRFVLLLCGVLCWVACRQNEPQPTEVPEPGIAAWPEVGAVEAYAKYGHLRLSDYGFFEGRLSELHPTKGVHAYEVASALFSDYASKARLVYLPEGGTMVYDAREPFGFPEGAVLIKNFYYSAAQLGAAKDVLLETRLLIHEADGWKALPYVWNAEQTDAFLDVSGGARTVNLPGMGSFRYSIPNMQQCKSCHDRKGRMSPIGPVARQLHHERDGVSQLLTWHDAGLLEGYPVNEPPAAAVAYADVHSPLKLRARAYLDANCAYCHSPEGSAKNSGLDLSIFAESDYALGIGKAPVAAGKGSGGLRHDIVPGQPEASILLYRMQSNEPAVMMPELGRSLVHEEGVELIRAWIAEM